jgi:hypothetical protein
MTEQPVDAQQVDPEHARSELAAETPPHADAEEMEAALRVGGPLASENNEEQRRAQPTEPGPGTSLT